MENTFKRNLVTIVLALSMSFRGRASIEEYTDVVANVSLLLADYHAVDCLQIFRSNDLPPLKRETIRKLWRKLAVYDAKVTTGIYTYEKYINRKKAKPRKVSCYRSIKIMSDDEESRRGYAQLTKEFSIKDAVWVLFVDSLSVDFFKYAQIMFDDVIEIAVTKTIDLVLFYEIYRINQTFPLKILPLGNWTRSNGLALPQQTLYYRRSDLEGVVLKAASVENWPASYQRNKKWYGFFVELWNEIQSLINCTSIYVQSTENTVGMRMDNGSWNGLVGMALRKEIDILVTEVVIDKERSRAVNFLYPVTKTKFQIYMRHLGYEWQWWAVLKPFHESVWSAVLAWVLLGSVFMGLSYRLCLFYGLETFDFEKPFTPFKSFLFVMQALCQQGYDVIPKSYTCRILFWVSYAVSGVLIPSYSASLVSSLAQKTTYKAFNSLQEMVEDGTYHLLVKENSPQHAFFAHAKDGLLKTAYTRLVETVPIQQKKLGLRQSLNFICLTPKYAVMGIEEIVEVRMSGSTRPDCTIIPLTFPVSTIHLTLATTKNNPYWGVINHHLQKLLVNGIVSRLEKSEFPPTGHAKKKGSKEVGLKQLVTAFVFIGSFAAISVLIFCFEIRQRRQEIIRNNGRRKKRLLRQQQTQIILEYELKMYKNLRPLP